MIAPVLVALGVDVVVARRRAGWSPWGAIATASLLVAPLQSCAVGFLGWTIRRFATAARMTKRRRDERTACLEAGELVALALAGGLSVGAAHRVALAHVAPAGVAAVGELVAAIERDGTRAGLSGDEGPMSGGSRVLAAAVESGAGALSALAAHLDLEAHRRHSEQVEAMGRLPVRLLLPLTLLVLPGFVLMTVGPTVIESLARLNP